MKSIKWKLSGVFCILIFSFSYSQSKSVSKNYFLSDIESIPIVTHEFTSPIWSPDGIKIMLTKNGYNGVFIFDTKNNKLKKINEFNGSGFNATWSTDSKQIFYRKKISDNSYEFNVDAINIGDLQITNKNNIKANAIQSTITASKENDPIVYVNQKTLKIECTNANNSRTWIITNEPGQYYQPILSHDKKRVIVHKEGEMVIYSIFDSKLIKNLGNGIACNWSFDDKKILFFLSEDDGYKITGSDIYIFDVMSYNRINVSKSKNSFELWPNWSDDNKKIIYVDDKSGKIFTANFTEK